MRRALSAPVQPPVAETTPIQPRDTGERRHLTVLFCDLVGSIGIAAQLDPEEWRETVSSYHRTAAEAITRSGGHVAKYLGDGVMAFFGYPEAHDDDAERAARAGLAILDAMAKFNEQSPSGMRTSQTRLLGSAGAPPSVRPKLSARIGIHSGAVAAVHFPEHPFYPVTEMLRELLAWRGDHSAAGSTRTS